MIKTMVKTENFQGSIIKIEKIGNSYVVYSYERYLTPFLDWVRWEYKHHSLEDAKRAFEVWRHRRLLRENEIRD